MQEEQDAMNPNIRVVKKHLTISHTQQRAPPISIPISTKRKDEGYKKKKEFRTQSNKKNKKKHQMSLFYVMDESTMLSNSN